MPKLNDMDNSKNELFQYYNERAPEYEAFYYGKFPTPHPEPDIYNNDRLPIQPLVSQYISGRCIDIACGTGFWLPFYYRNCPAITLIDQSENMLAECSKKVKGLGIENTTSIVRGDIFNHGLPFSTYDSALAGFLISHFNDAELADFFRILKAVLIGGGKFVIIDSIWNDEIKTWRLEKAGANKRKLFDGREYEIYKRFFEKTDLVEMAGTYHFNLQIVYWGNLFFTAVGQFDNRQA